MKTVPLETSEKVYNLKMTTNALIYLQQHWKEDLTEMEQLRLTLYCLLMWENKELDLEQVGNIMDDVIYSKGFVYLAEAMEKAQKNYFGEELYQQFVQQAGKLKKK